jgi:predicted Zn-dependent protease
MIFNAEFLDGLSSRSQEVLVELLDNTLFIRDSAGALLAEWRLDLIRDENIPPHKDMLLLSVGAANSARLRITDTLFVEQIGYRCPSLRKRRKADHKGTSKLIAAVAGVVVLVVVGFTYGIPYLAGGITALIPDETRQQVGDLVKDQIIESVTTDKDAGTAVCSNSVSQRSFVRLLDQLSEVSGDQNNRIQITIINSPEANAFALPGGQILVFAGLLKLTDDPNAIAAVIAHEYAHVLGQHPEKLYVSNLGMAAALSLIFGDVSGGTAIAAIGQMALGASYSREFEREADKFAISSMSALNYDVSPLALLLEKLASKQPEPGILSFIVSHPGVEERKTHLKAAGNTGTENAFTKSEWLAIKSVCEKSV